MKKVINYLLLSSFLFLMFFSCKNIFSEPLTQNTYEQQVEKFGSISGKIDFGNACPQQFITKLCDDNHLTNKKTAFPTIPYDKELTYKIYAQCTEDNTPPIEGTLYSSSDLKLEYYFDSIPFNKNYIIHIEVYLDEQIILSGSSSEFSLSPNTQTEIENIKVSVTQNKDSGKGNIKLPVQQSNSYDFYYKLEEYSSENRDVLLIDNSYTKTTDNLIKAENISSGVYKLQIIVCAKNNINDLKYSCTEIVNVFDNLTTDTWIRNGEGDEYFSEVPLNPDDIQSEKVLKFTITEDFLFKKSNEIYVDPESEKTPTGSYFYPYKTLQDAIDKVLSDSIFDEYTIYLKKDIIITEKPKNGGYVGNIVYAGFDKALTITSKGEPKTIKIAENINHESSTEEIGYFRLGIGSAVKISNINLENSNSKTPIYVNSALNLENVNIKNSYAVANQSPDTLFDNDSAVIYNNNKITLKNVTINNEEAITNKENYNTVYGRAILNTYNYTVCELDNVTIDSCIVKSISGASGGGIYEEGAEEFIVSNSTIKNCYANGDGGGIYCRQTCSVQNSTIENCTAAGNGGGIFTSTSAYLAVSGKVIIFGNTNTSNNPSNVYLSTNQKISLENPLNDGTLIGITTQEELTETKQQIEFIENYGLTPPASCFRSDKDYKVDINDAGMPVLTVYKGNINIEPFYENVKISLDKTNVLNSETINVIVKVDEEEFEITEPNSISVDLNWRNINISSSTTQQITIPDDRDDLPPDNYIISVLLTLNGKTYSANFDIEVFEDKVLTLAKSGSVPAAGDKLTISSGKSISQIATWVNSGESLEGVEFKLENDVALPENFVSIGNSSKPFIGTFDGNGKTITIKSFASGSSSFFGYIDTPSGKSCTIENLTLAGDLNITGNFYGFVSYCQDGVILKNCVNKCNITATGSVAGFTSGVNNSSYIENCRNEGNLTSTGGKAAGISISGGSGSYKLKKCSNAGKITGKNYVGGIMAQKAFVTNIMNCYNEGEITGDSYVGGIAGSCYTYNTSATIGITNCYNTGTVTAKQYAGGIVGSTYDTTGEYAYCAISNCVNYGTVTCTDNPASAGGIIGLVHQLYQDEPSRFNLNNNYYLDSLLNNSTYNIGIGEQSSEHTGNTKITSSEYNTTLMQLNSWIENNNSDYGSKLVTWKLDSNGRLILDMEN